MEAVHPEESEDFNKGYDEGYADGRMYYENDILSELGNLNTTLKFLNKYSPEATETIKDLERVRKVLNVVLEKAKSKKFLE